MCNNLFSKDQEAVKTRLFLVQNAPVSVRSLYYYVKTVMNPPLQTHYVHPFRTSEGELSFVHVFIPDIKLALNVNEPFTEGLLSVLRDKNIKAVNVELSPDNIDQARNLICTSILDQFRLALARRVEAVHFYNLESKADSAMDKEDSEEGEAEEAKSADEPTKPSAVKISSKKKRKVKIDKKCANCKYSESIGGGIKEGTECLCFVQRKIMPLSSVCSKYEHDTKKVNKVKG